MKIALLAPRFPYPPDRGDRLNISKMLQLFSRDHEVTLFSFLDGTEPPEAVERVSRFCHAIETVRLGRTRSWAQAWASLFTLTPSQVGYYRSREMEERVRARVASERYDVIAVHLIRMAPFVERLDHPARVLWLWDSLGLSLGRSARVAPLWKRPGILWEAWRVNRFTVRMTRAMRESWVLSAVDQRHLIELGAERVELVPHGSDLELLDLERAPAPDPEIVFLGNLSVPHNVDAACFAAREVWPLVRSRWPRATLRLVGASPTSVVRSLAALPGVEVTGLVPDLRPVWARAHVMLAALRFSAGIQNKLLEAMAAGVPVVTVPDAAEAIGAEGGQHLLLGTSAPQLADAVDAVLRSPETAAERAARARELVRRNFGWDATRDRLEAAGQAAGAARRERVAPAV